MDNNFNQSQNTEQTQNNQQAQYVGQAQNNQQQYDPNMQYGGANQYTQQTQYGGTNQYTQQTQYGMQQQSSGVRCPMCGSTNMQVLQDHTTKGKDFSASKGCCGALMFGPIGILCGSCGKGKQVTTINYWMCLNCGNKFKV